MDEDVVEEEGEEELQVVAQKSIWNPTAARSQLTILMLASVMANSFVRNTISMGIVCMVNSTAGEGNCSDETDADEVYEGDLIWTSAEKGYVISAMYWGGLVTALPAGYFADRYSPKILVALCLLVNMIGCLLTPVAAVYGGLIPVIALRFLMGFGGQATIYPPISAMCARWIPPTERSTVIAIYTSGAQMSVAIGAPLNAWLCRQVHLLGGWPSIFYLTGIGVAPVLFLWCLLAKDNPSDYWRIKKSELNFIRESLKKENVSEKPTYTSWRQILTCPALLVTLLSNFAYSGTSAILQSYVPLYLKQAMRMGLKRNGIFSALPSISQWLGKLIFASAADYFRTKNLLSATWICKIFNCIGTFGSSAFFTATAFMTCSQSIEAVAFIASAASLFSCQTPGFLTSLSSIAPRYAGTVNALSRFFGQIGSVTMPLIVGAVTGQATNGEWQIVFFILAGLMTFAGFLFLIFGSASIQRWAQPIESLSEERLIT